MIALMLAGGGLVLVGVAAGFVAGRNVRSAAPKPPVLVCSCGHGHGHHDGDGCHGTHRREAWGQAGGYIGKQLHPCGCRRYDGPEPPMSVREIIGGV